MVEAIFYVGLFGWIIATIFLLRKWLLTKSWKITQGKILSTTIEKYLGNDGYYFKPVIRYRYVIDGKIIESDKWSLDKGNPSTEQGAQQIISQYQIGQAVVIHYDPMHPQRSLLDVSFPKMSAGILAALGTVLIYFGFHLFN